MSQSEIHAVGTTSKPEDERIEEGHTDLEKKLREHLHQRKGVDSAARIYLEKGTLRNTASLTEAEYDKVERLMERVEPIPKYCYRNSQCAILELMDESLGYVEGFTLSREVPFPVQHAWVEVNGKVAEITIPHSPLSPSDAVYLGVEYDLEMLTHVREEDRLGYPIAGNMNQREKVGEFRE